MPDQHVNTLRQNYFRLVTLGRVALLTPAGEDAELGKRRRKLAVLAVLALARRAPTRDQLAEMFWGDEPDERARHSLSDALSHLRRVLGRDAIAARREVVSLEAGAPLAVDAVELAAAAEAGDHARVVELYGGPFLPDLHVDRSASFAAWVTRERDRLAHLFATACAARCAALARDHAWDDVRALAARWLDTAPRSADAQLLLLRAGAASSPDGMRAALDTWHALVARLDREHDAAPDPRAVTEAERLEAQLSASLLAELPIGLRDVTPAEAGVHVYQTRDVDPGVRRGDVQGRPTTRSNSWRLTALGTAAVIAVAALAIRARRAEPSDPGARPLIAVTAIRPTPDDTAIAWLGEGLVQMIASHLERADGVDVVAPARVREVIARAGWNTSLVARDTTHDLDVARRLRATVALDGSVARGDGGSGYVLDLTVRDTRSGTPVRHFAVSGSDVIAVADQAAAYALAAVGETAPGPHLSDVETASAEAYRHFTSGTRELAEGRQEDAARELDVAIALDSGFVSALVARMHMLFPPRDSAAYARLRELVDRAASRVTEWDRLSGAVYAAMHGGEHARAESLARELVARYPRDPRAYAALADVYTYHGRAAEADTVLAQLLALDSLAIDAGTGPCAPCEAYGRRIGLHVERGDLAGAERLARRWQSVQPGIAAPWLTLSSVLSFEGRFDESLDAVRRAEALVSDGASLREYEARALLMAGRTADAERVIAPFASDTGAAGAAAFDIRATAQRERGELRAALRTLEAFRLRMPRYDGLVVLEAHARGRAGDVAGARQLFETHPRPDVSSGPGSLSGDDARAFAWQHALYADAIAERADTSLLRVLADSIEHVGARSYYGRDWRLHHHVRGLIAMRAGRWADAAREFERARWGRGGWTRTNVELARADLALGAPAAALAALRDAYLAPLDAMGRYVPRTEVHYWMALAFARAGMRDSARVYAARVRAAWAHADADVRARLDSLP